MGLKEKILNKSYDEIKDIVKNRIKILDIFDFDIIEIKEGFVKIRVKHKDIMEREGKILFGGVIALLFDFVLGLTVSTVNEKEDQVTINLNIEFLRKAQSNEYIIEGRVVKKGKNVVFVEGFIKNDKTFAKANGIWLLFE